MTNIQNRRCALSLSGMIKFGRRRRSHRHDTTEYPDVA